MSQDIFYAITNGSGDVAAIVACVHEWAASRRIRRLQIREKRLSALALYDLTVRVVKIARPAGIEVLVNERADVALAAGADGVHLPSRAISPASLRRLGVRMIGVSCHDAGELGEAEAEGADFAVLAPVFAPLSKKSMATPLGLDGFRSLALSVKIPVLALGGITAENIEACLDAGAAGVAGITLFNAFLPRSSTETAAHPEPRSLPL